MALSTSRKFTGAPVSLTEGRKIMGYSQDTICVQGGWRPKNGEPRVLPIYQSTTFKYATSEEMGKLFDLRRRDISIPSAEPDERRRSTENLRSGGRRAPMLTSSARRQRCLLLPTSVRQATTLSARQRFTRNLQPARRYLKTIRHRDYPRAPGCAGRGAEKAFQPNTKAVFAETISTRRCCT